MHNVGLIGLGYWGPHVARSFELTGRARVRWLCDLDAPRLQVMRSAYPGAKTTTNVDDLFGDPERGSHAQPVRLGLEQDRAAPGSEDLAQCAHDAVEGAVEVTAANDVAADLLEAEDELSGVVHGAAPPPGRARRGSRASPSGRRHRDKPLGRPAPLPV